MIRALLVLLLGCATLVTGGTAHADTFSDKVEKVEAALMADPDAALRLAREAAALAEAKAPGRETQIAQATALRLEAEALLGLNRLAEAEPPAVRAKALIEGAAPTAKIAGDIERTLGAIAGMQGRVQRALAHHQNAYRIYTAADDRRARSIALLDIGQIYWDAADYDRVLRYFAQAEELMPRDDASLLLALHNARGEVLRTMGRSADADAEYAKALDAAKRLKSEMLEARILTNRADAQIEAGRLGAAGQTIAAAFHASRQPDAAEWRPFIHAAAAQLAERRNDLDRAASQIRLAFAGQDLTSTSMAYREAHQIAARIFERRGEEASALAHLRANQRLDKEAQRLIATNSAQLMAAQFDFTNQNLRIAQLKQGQLERDIAIERQRSRYRTNLFTGLALAGAIVLGVALYGFFSVRRSRNQVRAANTELAGTNVALEKALKAKTEFLATTSHEIRTPLNGILGMTQVLLTNRSVPGDVREQIEVVHGAGETMRALVDDLLDVAKLEHGDLTLVEERVAIRDLVSRAVTLWRSQAEEKGLTVDCDLAGLPEHVLTDAGRVRQILFNLLSNAVKFTPVGSISVSASLREEGPEPALRLIVRDSGIGIDENDQARVFEAFSQVDGGMTRQFSGTGLGLSIVRQLVERFGGSIVLESALGEGATFTVDLPVRTDAASEAAGGSSSLAGCSMLLIDADPDSRRVAQSLLSGRGAKLSVAGSVADALDAFDTASPGIVIINARTMADDEGVESIRQIAARVAHAGGRLAVQQGMLGIPSIAELMMLRPDQIIMQPVEDGQFVQAILTLAGDEPAAFVDAGWSGGKLAA